MGSSPKEEDGHSMFLEQYFKAAARKYAGGLTRGSHPMCKGPNLYPDCSNEMLTGQAQTSTIGPCQGRPQHGDAAEGQAVSQHHMRTTWALGLAIALPYLLH